MSTFQGFLNDFPEIRVDHFCDSSVSTYFLSHAHADHMNYILSLVGTYRKVHCSPETKRLLLKIYPKNSKTCQPQYAALRNNIVALNMEQTNVFHLGGTPIRVIPFSANHCPGSTMFVFERDQIGGAGVKRTLYTGDIRAEPKFMEKVTENSFFRDADNRIKRFDDLYLDTTFAHPNYDYFPPKIVAIEHLLEFARRHPSRHICVLSRCLGYEEIWVALAKEFNQLVHVDARWYAVHRESSEIGPYISNDSSRTRLHACGGCDEFTSNENANNGTRIFVGGGTWPSPDRIMLPVQGDRLLWLAFVMHSSQSELKALQRLIRPKYVHPCVMSTREILGERNKGVIKTFTDNLIRRSPTRSPSVAREKNAAQLALEALNLPRPRSPTSTVMDDSATQVDESHHDSLGSSHILSLPREIFMADDARKAIFGENVDSSDDEVAYTEGLVGTNMQDIINSLLTHSQKSNQKEACETFEVLVQSTPDDEYFSIKVTSAAVETSIISSPEASELENSNMKVKTPSPNRTGRKRVCSPALKLSKKKSRSVFDDAYATDDDTGFEFGPVSSHEVEFSTAPVFNPPLSSPPLQEFNSVKNCVPVGSSLDSFHREEQPTESEAFILALSSPSPSLQATRSPKNLETNPRDMTISFEQTLPLSLSSHATNHDDDLDAGDLNAVGPRTPSPKISEVLVPDTPARADMVSTPNMQDRFDSHVECPAADSLNHVSPKESGFVKETTHSATTASDSVVAISDANACVASRPTRIHHQSNAPPAADTFNKGACKSRKTAVMGPTELEKVISLLSDDEDCFIPMKTGTKGGGGVDRKEVGGRVARRLFVESPVRERSDAPEIQQRIARPLQEDLSLANATGGFADGHLKLGRSVVESDASSPTTVKDHHEPTIEIVFRRRHMDEHLLESKRKIDAIRESILNGGPVPSNFLSFI